MDGWKQLQNRKMEWRTWFGKIKSVNEMKQEQREKNRGE